MFDMSMTDQCTQLLNNANLHLAMDHVVRHQHHEVLSCLLDFIETLQLSFDQVSIPFENHLVNVASTGDLNSIQLIMGTATKLSTDLSEFKIWRRLVFVRTSSKALESNQLSTAKELQNQASEWECSDKEHLVLLDNCIQVAVSNGHLNLVEYMLGRMSDLQTKEQLDQRFATEWVECFSDASAEGDLQLVTLYVKSAASINKHHWKSNCCHFISRVLANGHIELVEYLITQWTARGYAKKDLLGHEASGILGGLTNLNLAVDELCINYTVDLLISINKP